MRFSVTLIAPPPHWLNTRRPTMPTAASCRLSIARRTAARVVFAFLGFDEDKAALLVEAQDVHHGAD